MKKSMLGLVILFGFCFVGINQVSADEKTETVESSNVTDLKQDPVIDALEIARAGMIGNLTHMKDNGSIGEELLSEYKTKLLNAKTMEELNTIYKEVTDEINKINPLEIARAGMIGNLTHMKNNGRISEELLSEYKTKLLNAKTMEELEAIYKEVTDGIDKINPLEIARAGVTSNLTCYYEEGKITKAQFDGFLKEIAKATTIEELEAIQKKALEGNEGKKDLSVVKAEITKKLEQLFKDGLITETQLKDFLSRLEKVASVDEANAIYTEATNLSQGDFKDRVKNVENKINQLLKDGKITQKQADEYLSRLSKITTDKELANLLDELNNISKETTQKTKEKTENKKGLLPKTGEKNSSVLLVLGFLSIGVLGSIKLFKNN